MGECGEGVRIGFSRWGLERTGLENAGRLMLEKGVGGDCGDGCG